MAVRIEREGLALLFNAVRQNVDRVYGPSLRDGAIVLEELADFSDLPRGIKDKQEPGKYTIEETNEPHYFGYVVGPQSLKQVLAPARRKLWEAHQDKSGAVSFHAEQPQPEKLAFFGVRACDLKALEVTDRVYLGPYPDEHYQSLRPHLFLVTATCHRPSAVCFCTSMGYGPKAAQFDLNITEVLQENAPPYYLIESGSTAGEDVLNALGEKDQPECDQQIKDVYEQACQQITKTMKAKDAPDVIKANLEHTAWEDVAERCLSCGNCTAVCPTCFCSTTYDVNDLEGEHSERWLRQDSCFTSDISYIHGGAIRPSTMSRYRQWLSHKLSTWWDQFGTSGCVGCGRCISWCPVGIDLTQMIESLGEQE